VNRRPPLRDPRDPEILRLAIPALGALVAEPLFLLADSAIVARLGTPQLAGLAVAGTVLATLVSVCIFLAYGTTAAVARQLGAGDVRAAIRQGIDGMWLAAALGVLIATAGLATAPRVVAAFDASSSVAPYALTYLRISLLGVPAMLVVLASTGVLRGLQDTRTPLLIAVGGAAANVALEVLFVFGFRWGIAGSAWATVTVQTASALIYVAVVRRGARRNGAPARPDLAGIRAAAHSGLPLVVRTLSLRVVLVVATAVASRLSDAELAAYQVSFAIWMFLALGLDAVAIAGQAIVGRCLGAADVEGARAATTRMLEWGLSAGVIVGMLLVALRPLYVPLFTPDPEVQGPLSAALVVVAVLQVPGGPVFVYDGVLIGAGDARYLAAAGLVTMLAFLPAAAVVLVWDLGLVWLWWALGVFMFARLVLLHTRARSNAWLVTGAVRR
jgi:putative MATE family efflux protein